MNCLKTRSHQEYTQEMNNNQNTINMNRVLTPDLLKEVYGNVHRQMMASNAPTKERFVMSNSMLVEALKHCDILGAEYTQRLYDLGFPDDGNKSMLTLQEIIDVCDKGMRWKGKSADGVELDMPVKLEYRKEKDEYSTYRVVGTFEGKDYVNVGYCAPCALKALFRMLERDLECGFLTFETK